MMEIQFNEKGGIPAEGIFSIRVKDLTGKVLIDDIEHNMIVLSSKTMLSRLIGNDGEGYPITRLAFGTTPAAASPSDTEISGVTPDLLEDGPNLQDGNIVAFVKRIHLTEYPEYNQVSFSWELGYSEGNGLDITEFALLSDNGTMFSRKARGVIAKEADLSIEGVWTLIF